MTSEVDDTKTNEFLHRRKLRLQQVREQSKDIAKKIRQRAKVEKLRQVVELDSKKQKEYLRRQEQLVKQLEEYYAKGIQNVGASHRNTSEVQLQEAEVDKVDLSKKRGKEAATEVRKKRQQILNEQKKILDRKLLAREAANEISRDKSAAVVNKLQSKNKGTEDSQSKSSGVASDKDANTKLGKEKDRDVARNDMGTQWDIEEMPNEWDTNIPTLSLPKDDNSVKESNNYNVDSKAEKSKRLDLFALSEEMPSSLRGGLTSQERVHIKPSLTLVSEYLQTRCLRLRESDTASSSKKNEDLQRLKQTIQRTRATKEVPAKAKIDAPFKSSSQSTAAPSQAKRCSVTMYNHSTRDSRDIPYNDDRFVVRDSQPDEEEDAYSQAMKESSTTNTEKQHQKKIQEIRSKVAMTKQNVEKEYKDTISFLNSLPKDKANKPIRTAFMDEERQKMQRESRQQKLQQEFRRIEKECSKHISRNKPQIRSISPSQACGDVFESTDFQYSWMPVPESDGNLAIHTIPTTLKEGKSANSVKFSKVDSYHEYRSRHKHTPPTKDTAHEKPRRHVEAVVIQNTSDSESVSSESSPESAKHRKKDKPVTDSDKLSDAERVIVYKILDSATSERSKNTKLLKDIAKSLTMIEEKNSKKNDSTNDQDKRSNIKKTSINDGNKISFEQLNEGVYKAKRVDKNGDNITSMYIRDRDDKIEISSNEVASSHTCTCSKTTTMSKEQQQTAPISLQWESGDKTPRSHSETEECRCNCKGPTISTSMSSFKTATNDKANNAVPDGGFIKLIDDGGQEAGKFYIGASGFLKDDNYEVIIQLRKKGDEREISREKSENTGTSAGIQSKEDMHLIQDKPSVDKVSIATETSACQTISVENRETIKNKSESLTTVSTGTVIHSVRNNTGLTHTENVNAVFESQNDLNSKHDMPSEKYSMPASENVTAKPTINISEKGVSTEIQDTSVQTNIPKSDPTSRPATSTYTQTSMSSPNHRPVLFHMSSSTSTAYMSPPEIILPKFLRRDYELTSEEINDVRNYDPEKMEYTENHDYSEEYDCRCKQCTHARKVILNKHVEPHNHQCRKSRQNSSTPPNTARTCRFEDRDPMKAKKNPLSSKKSKCKCGSRYLADDEHSLDQKKCRHIAAKHSSQKFVMRMTSNRVSNKDRQPTSKRSENKLKPIVKNYVDKLLVLNKESLKAVQVIDQDCSSVTTPGSSIIDMPNNIDHQKPTLERKLSLQQITSELKQKLMESDEKKRHKISDDPSYHDSKVCLKKRNSRNRLLKLPRKKSVHKVKSLNISKNLSRDNKSNEIKQSQKKPISSSSSTKGENVKKPISLIPSRNKVRSKSSPTPRLAPNSDTTDRSANSDIIRSRSKRNIKVLRSKFPKNITKQGEQNLVDLASRFSASSHRGSMTSTTLESDMNPSSLKRNTIEIPMSISTQTSINVDSETHYMKLAEGKLQNMEKIADLTEKCTQRLSNLAKVLDQVRKNKTLAYSQISTSDTTSDSDQKADKNVNKVPAPSQKPFDCDNIGSETKSRVVEDKGEIGIKEKNSSLDSTEYVPFLSDIPKPTFTSLNSDLGINSSSSSSRKSNTPSPDNEHIDHPIKNRGKPPPALSRIHLKHVQEFIVPHELSTVVEVDSPMSVKRKSSRNDTKLEIPDSCNRSASPIVEYKKGDANNNPDLLDRNLELSDNHDHRISVNEQSDNSKVQMIDMKQFNEIMLKPFFSLQEYAKQCNVTALDEGSNLDDIVKDDQINDELSSLHSEASLPDVISELLKRNIITEPFKFDTGSNANSTTISSESTISVLALSKARHAKKKTGVIFKNKENIAETSDTMSISSNPDLENAFKKLGMGWASSTLKKTKERLALSSSSNTSSSSLSQFRVRSFNQDVPALVTDTVSSVLNQSKKPIQRNAAESSKNAEQQTSLVNSMTVKEFLTKELAKKITFTNKSRNETEEEFVSLFETKMPEEMKHSSRMVREDNSIDNSMRSGNNRARTSTPVQLFKSMTYHSSSSSNISNGLFSNADDLSSVKLTSNSMKHSTSDKDDLIIPNFSLRMKRGSSECSKSD